MKKKFVCLIVIIFLLCFALPTLASCSKTGTDTIKIANWAEYIGEDVISKFATYYKEITGRNINVVYDTISTNEEMLNKVAAGQADFDLICPSDYMIEKMRKENLLIKFSKDLGNDVHGNPIEDYRGNISQLFKDWPHDPTNEYSVGYMWGTMGILYNVDMVNNINPTDNNENGVPDIVESWACLWDSSFANKIVMKDSIRDSFCITGIYNNVDYLSSLPLETEEDKAYYNKILSDIMNDTTDDAIASIANSLIAQKPLTLGYSVDQDKVWLIEGSAICGLQWAGDAVFCISEAESLGNTLAYYIPDEGSNIFTDGFVIPKYAKNVYAANLFANFICRDDIAIENMDYIGYSSVIATQEVADYLSESYLATGEDETVSEGEAVEPGRDLSYFFGSELGGAPMYADPNMFPDYDVILKCAIMRDFGQASPKITRMWCDFKAAYYKDANFGSKFANAIFISIIVLSVLALLAYVVIQKTNFMDYITKKLNLKKSGSKK